MCPAALGPARPGFADLHAQDQPGRGPEEKGRSSTRACARRSRSAVRALEEGVQRVHFIDGRLPHSLLLEIFTDKGIGTEIVHG